MNRSQCIEYKVFVENMWNNVLFVISTFVCIESKKSGRDISVGKYYLTWCQRNKYTGKPTVVNPSHI